MKTIQWFPGHMTGAMRMMEQNLSLVDGVIFVLDARCPAASFNAKLKKLLKSKPVLYVFNKADLADERADILLSAVKSTGAVCVKANSVNTGTRRALTEAIKSLVAQKREAAAAKGYNRVFRFMVAGVPNTGKSTLINALAGSKRAETGDKAGVTRGKQWIKCDGFELLDTPGTMPPAFENQYLARHLAYVGSINDDILEMDEIALALLEELAANYPKRLEERYSVKLGQPLEMLEGVCARRGFILRGGEYDYERGERAIIDDFRKGRLGRITLDSVEDITSLEF
ncbi:MAG: ribosome biogenesis GTPase YlqF [Clostridiales bacterium]|nr:ribosome biogenesis GTPase YlqF [Clostridiales bacterium]